MASSLFDSGVWWSQGVLSRKRGGGILALAPTHFATQKMRTSDRSTNIAEHE